MFSGEITGLKPPGNHGFHVHQVFDGDDDGDLGDHGRDGHDEGYLMFSGNISIWAAMASMLTKLTQLKDAKSSLVLGSSGSNIYSRPT